MNWLKRRWLLAQGIDEFDLHRWGRDDYFQRIPPRCIVCGRPWRPDRPPYLAVFGHVYRLVDNDFLDSIAATTVEMAAINANSGGLVWRQDAMDVSRPTGCGKGHIRDLCTEHGDRWDSLIDACTGESVTLRLPPTRLQRAWRDAHYWSKTALWFAWRLVKDGTFCTTHPLRWWRWCRFQEQLRKQPREQMERTE